jgi:vancomycin permeability regulator SanA
MKYHGPGKYFFMIGLLVSSGIIFSCQYTKEAAQRRYDHASTKTYDLVIVPGVPLEDPKMWSRTMKGRVYWAKFLYDKGIAKNLMFSGSAVYSPYYEGMIMAMYAHALGVPQKNIFSEIRAEHSTENIYYSYKKGKKLGFKTFAVASDPFQTKQLARYTRMKVSSSIDIIPFVVDTLKTIEPYMVHPRIDYNQAYVKDFVPLTKRETWWKRQKGTWGWNINNRNVEY